MKALLMTATAAVMLAACATIGNDLPPPPPMVPTGILAATYLPSAASGDIFEIRSSQLALQRACSPAVRSFAQMLISDHTRMSGLLLSTARNAGLPEPAPVMAPHHQQMLDRLAGTPAASFDAAFRADQIAAHEEALTLHRSYADDGDHPALRGVAAQAVPAIEAHLGHAQSLPTGACAPSVAAPPEDLRRGERG